MFNRRLLLVGPLCLTENRLRERSGTPLDRSGEWQVVLVCLCLFAARDLTFSVVPLT